MSNEISTTPFERILEQGCGRPCLRAQHVAFHCLFKQQFAANIVLLARLIKPDERRSDCAASARLAAIGISVAGHLHITPIAMPRRARLVLPGIALHITQRGNNRQACFLHDADYRHYLHLLESSAAAAQCQVHAFVLMTNHVHLLVTPHGPAGPAAMMKSLGERYVQYVNRRHARSGTLWEGRYRSSPVDSERYLLSCYRYIELNPVRASMVRQPADYRWSSNRANGHGISSALITPHPLYEALGVDATDRQQAYRALFDVGLPDNELDRIRKANRGNAALGSPTFIARVEEELGRAASPRRRGRRAP